mgnify:FL=1
MIETPNNEDIDTNQTYNFILKKKINKNILDIGIGGGVALNFLNLKKNSYVGIDINNKYINELKLKNKNINISYYNQDFTKELDIKFQNKFDICIASHVIEHIKTDKVEKFIMNLIKSIKKIN